MSLNKFTDNTIKNYLNIGCNSISCSNLTEGKINPIICDVGGYSPNITMDKPNTITVNNILFSVINKKFYLWATVKANITPGNSLTINIPMPGGLYNGIENQNVLGLFGCVSSGSFTKFTPYFMRILNNNIEVTLTSSGNVLTQETFNISANLEVDLQ